MRIYHLALESEWRAALRSGAYTTSTLGSSLEDVGFIHASREEQVRAVHDAFYATVRQPLVLLEVETDRLTSPWREDPVGDDTFPHIYGPLNVDAVVAVHPWHRSGRPKAFLEVYLGEAGVRIGLALLAMVLAVVGAVLGRAYGDGWAGFLGALVGLAVGVGIGVLALRWRARRTGLR